MIRVAFFAPWLITGGTQRHLQQVLRHLDRTRFDARVCTIKPGGEVADELAAAGVPVESIAVGSALARPRAVLAMVRAARRLRAERIQVLHGFQWRPALVGSIIGRLARIPLVFAGKRSLTGEDSVARRAWRTIGRQVDTIVTNAAALQAEGERDGIVARWEVIPSGVDADHFVGLPDRRVARASFGLDPEQVTIGTVGRLESRKGHETLLGAAAELGRRGQPLQVLLAGDGPSRRDLVRRAGDLGLDARVRFVGNLSDVRPALAAMDVFVLPSQAEGMSNALLEAMAAGLPVVATDVGGNAEALGAGGGVLVAAGDPNALADAVAGLLAGPARAAEFGRAGQRAVAERFSARAMVARLERLYEGRLATAQRGLAA